MHVCVVYVCVVCVHVYKANVYLVYVHVCMYIVWCVCIYVRYVCIVYICLCVVYVYGVYMCGIFTCGTDTCIWYMHMCVWYMCVWCWCVLISYMCIWYMNMCVWYMCGVCACVQAGTLTHVYAEPREEASCSDLSFFSFFLWKKYLPLNLELSWHLAGPRRLLSSLFTLFTHKHNMPTPSFLHGCWRFKLITSAYWLSVLTNFTTSSVLQNYKFSIIFCM